MNNEVENMLTIYIVIGIFTALFLISSYSAVVNGTKWGAWVTGICLWIIFMVIIGAKMFK